MTRKERQALIRSMRKQLIGLLDAAHGRPYNADTTDIVEVRMWLGNLLEAERLEDDLERDAANA